MEPQPVVKPKVKRLRWLQFKLRTFFLLLFLISLPLAWIGNGLGGKYQEQELVKAIEKAGGGAEKSFVDRLTIPWNSSEGETLWVSRRVTGVSLTAGAPAELRALLARLNCLTCLRGLDLRDPWVTEADLHGIERLSNLTKLDLTGTYMGDGCADVILRLPKLKHLRLAFTNLSDAGLLKLVRYPGLESIEVDGTRVTDAAIAKFIRERPGIEVFWDGHPSRDWERYAADNLRRFGWSITVYDGSTYDVDVPEREQDLSEAEIIYLKHLSFLELTIPAGAPRNSLASLQEIPGLKRLTLEGPVDRAALENTSKARSSTLLPLKGGQFTEQSLAPLSALGKLEHLNLPNAQFELGATFPLGKLGKLTSLDLSGSNLDDSSLVPLLQLTNLRWLEVQHTMITDEGLLRLAEIKSLKTVKVSFQGKLTRDGGKRFRELRPDMELK
jgi:Leucine-rich repeat (LRR) protein